MDRASHCPYETSTIRRRDNYLDADLISAPKNYNNNRYLGIILAIE